MRNLFKSLVFSALLLAPAAANAQIHFDFHIGTPPPPPRAYRVAPRPSPEYVWVEGYQYPDGGRYRWHDGYWTLPPYPGAYWVQPYYLGGTYYTGHWEGPRGMLAHDHRWDRARARDGNRGRRDRDNGRRDRNDNRRDDNRRR